MNSREGCLTARLDLELGSVRLGLTAELQLAEKKLYTMNRKMSLYREVSS